LAPAAHSRTLSFGTRLQSAASKRAPLELKLCPPQRGRAPPEQNPHRYIANAHRWSQSPSAGCNFWPQALDPCREIGHVDRNIENVIRCHAPLTGATFTVTAGFEVRSGGT
jgi:hypothetical protein